MAVETPYTTEALVTRLAGQLAVDLRTDHALDPETEMQDAIDAGTVDVDFYLADRYAAADIAASEWAIKHATYFALRYLCLLRLNGMPESVAKEVERRMNELELVRTRHARAPRLANSRRPVAVSNYHVDLRRFNNQVRTDRSRSTGVAEDYNRPLDHAPDNR